ncbi:MAG: cysteine--tRNA ligase, partial [Chloroflexi bacterium]|nr:cysteine--tRNA ligase [Chloroflexota bacterium]
FLDMDRILGLGLAQIAGQREEIDGELLALIREREEERRRKNWARADEIRRQLSERGITVEDTPKGSRWTRVSPL